ncbi:MAG: VOC family protein [Candidatus Thorarchaeota archaeon]|jgi:catechol 2,3-dioxygenase-like lactoylglutathione lyase family enzyme
MITGIDVVFIHVRDPTKMAEWYRDTLGIEMGFQTPDLHWQELQLAEGRSPTRLGLDHVGSNPSEVEQQRIMVSFGVIDIHSMVEALEKKGLHFYGNPKIIDAGPTLFATTKDPEGNWIQFSQRK